ncbi:hypothetical protein CYCD_12440 [Tenuifilaceae bacterium CYCD]|nr:hypothetical protein CYCD_12440 [Tenuifilaceae bacterium CYCD]
MNENVSETLVFSNFIVCSVDIFNDTIVPTILFNCYQSLCQGYSGYAEECLRVDWIMYELLNIVFGVTNSKD